MPNGHPTSIASSFRPGDHLCWLYETEDEHRLLLTEFLRQGLELGEQVTCALDAHSPEAIAGYLDAVGLDARQYLASGQLLLVPARNSYMPEGVFEPDSLMRRTEEFIRSSLARGCTGVRMTAEMTWAIRCAVPLDALVEHEYRANHWLAGTRCCGLCQYDRRHFPPEALLQVISGHPAIVVGTQRYDNPYYLPSERTPSLDLPGTALQYWLDNLKRDAAARDLAEEAFRNSQERYRQIVETANEGMWLIDAASRTTFVNGKMAEMLGYTPEEMAGRPLMDFVADSQKTLAPEKLETLRQGQSGQADGRLRRKDGTEIWAIVRASSLFDRAGAYAGALAMITDITERELARLRIEHLNELLLALRAVSQIITRETSQASIIKGACTSLVETRSYDDAVIVLTDGDSKPIAPARAGGRAGQAPEGATWPAPCARQALAAPGILTVESGASTCAGCPCACAAANRTMAGIRLESHGAVYGVLAVTIPGGRVLDAEERDLLVEVAGDIAFALQGLQQREERMRVEERYRSMFENMGNGVAIYRAVDDGTDFTIVDFNSAAEKMENVKRQDIMGRSAVEVFPGIRQQGLFDVLQRVWRTGIAEWHPPAVYEDARIHGWRENFVYRLATGEVVAIYEDVTERVRVEEEQEATIKLLSLVNEAGNSQALMKTITAFLKNWARCDAVGIRLRDGDDFPYHETSGFSDRFISAESKLCASDREGFPMRAADGTAVLECMCGSILNGRFDPSKPCYTEHGSFWSNDISAFYAEASPAELPSRVRTGCRGEGFQSVALIPLHCGQETIGLLQFNSLRKGCFSSQLISLLERLADSIAIAIEQRRAKEALIGRQNELQRLASELALTEERERRRIATNLHDQIGQSLALAKMELGALRRAIAQPDLARPVDKILRLVEQTIQDTRLLTVELSPPVLYELGLEAALEWLTEQFQEQHGIVCEFEDDRRPKPLDDDVRVVLFQSARELLMNVAKHAHARNVKVSACRLNQEIIVAVEDDGIGFDPSKLGHRWREPGGFGLFSIRERLGHMGGRMHIESLNRPGAGRGTKVILAAPLKLEADGKSS